VETFKIVSRRDSSKVLYQAEAESFKALVEAAVKAGADLGGAYLGGAKLGGANLGEADLGGANLGEAYLCGANLYGANLCGAKLGGANLRGANLCGAKGGELALEMCAILPSDGPIIGWKKCRGNVIVKLFIPSKAKRSHAAGRKCRAERAKVLEVIGAEKGISIHDGKTTYEVGKWVHCDKWDADRWNECGGGIHFYIQRLEAESHV